ncbi:MAG: FTR1 family protein, partial [Nitrospirota bacterium]
MFGIFLITWREALEAALIVGILLTYLKKIGEAKNFKYIYYGVILAILASLLFAYFSNAVSLLFQGSREEIFHAAILFLAVGVLTYMVVWMHHNARELKGELQQKADEALAKNRVWALSSLAFIGVFREGIETVLFLWGLLLDSGDLVSYYANITGGFAGIGLAVLMA